MKMFLHGGAAVLLAACVPGSPGLAGAACEQDLAIASTGFIPPPALSRVSHAPLAPTGPEGDGVTGWIEVRFDAPTSALALRLSSPGAACVQIDSLVDEAGRPWVTPPAVAEDDGAYCVSCPQRVAVGAGQGFYVLPSRDVPLPATQVLRLRAAVRDCETFEPRAPDLSSGAPEQLSIEAMPLPEVDEERSGVVRLELLLSRASAFYPKDADRGVLRQAVARVNDALRPGALRVEVAVVRRLDATDATVLEFERGRQEALPGVFAEVRRCDGSTVQTQEPLVPILFAGCLEEHVPLLGRKEFPSGFTTHIPGGYPAEGRADGIVIASRLCGEAAPLIPWTASSLGRVIAHELGHYLGLYHSVEADGRTDQLDDTDEANLMNYASMPFPEHDFSRGQLRVMRRHPAVRW